jgi:hypothetical protein
MKRQRRRRKTRGSSRRRKMMMWESWNTLRTLTKMKTRRRRTILSKNLVLCPLLRPVHIEPSRDAACPRVRHRIRVPPE